ncbi:MAG: hypothetical protein JO340_19140 [Acidobacteriaceae bacterium]|nr:hypothetical protein [Acidobacteriaceae bacterium]
MLDRIGVGWTDLEAAVDYFAKVFHPHGFPNQVLPRATRLAGFGDEQEMDWGGGRLAENREQQSYDQKQQQQHGPESAKEP